MTESTPHAELPVITPRMSCACKWRIGVAGLILVVVSVAGVWWWTKQARPLDRLPAVSLESVGPGVRRAITDATELVRKKPRTGAAWGRLGMVLLAHDFEEAAQQAFGVAQELEPKTARWAYCAGVVQAVIDPVRAIESFRRAAELAPEETWPKFRLAELLMDTQQLDQAGQVLQTLNADDQQTRVAYDQVRLALLHNDLSALRQVDQKQFQALQNGGNRRACLELLAQVWHRLGREAEADAIRDSLRKMIAPSEGWDDPYVSEIFELRRDPGWLANLAQSHFRANRPDQAVRQMEELISDYPDDPQWSIGLAKLWSQLKQPQRAIDVLNAAATQHPKSAEVQFEIGNLQFFSGNWPVAEVSYAEASRLKPDYALAYYNLGQSLLKQQRDIPALQAFRDALRCQPDLAPALVNLADLLSKRGQPADLKEARESLQRALKINPKDQRASELLDKLPKD